MEFTLLNIFSSSVFPLDLFVKIGDSPLYFWLINFSLPLPVRTCQDICIWGEDAQIFEGGDAQIFSNSALVAEI